MNHPLFYALLMLVAGIGIPVMAALNAGLGARLHSPALAAAILFAIGFCVALSYLLLTQGMPATVFAPHTPWYFYLGGFFVMFYILSITWVAPRFGAANAVAFVLLGQLIAMTVIDHFGLLGASQLQLSLKRALGLLLMAGGVFLVLAKPANG